MGNGSPAPAKEKKPQKFKSFLDESSPLLPRNQEEVEHVNGFNGASFAEVVFNLSTNIIGAGIMALPATMKVLGLIVGIAMIFFVAFLTGASIELLLRLSKAEKLVTYGRIVLQIWKNWKDRAANLF
ncbi:sodium-coupled neutral amino acid transporter 2-like protein [Cinnamomum micranthum f. kanehirae]|uniref:Sodium-coupled neutral amino acid transporter 2-like protein n=1 Tax=Cinnamomum micranthum f. kanehirae TaxID=337451 RepID=A0A3S3PJN4_9MAGN|nr:sodium-coupled neutral amino acid transporter 2-like protein [Cinnamomum micranthum f. kanehirae]